MNDIVICIPIQLELHIRCSATQIDILGATASSPAPNSPAAIIPHTSPAPPSKPSQPSTRRFRVGKFRYSVDGGTPLSVADAATAARVSPSMIYLAVKGKGRCKGHTITRVNASTASADSEGE